MPNGTDIRDKRTTDSERPPTKDRESNGLVWPVEEKLGNLDGKIVHNANIIAALRPANGPARNYNSPNRDARGSLNEY